VVVEMTYRNTRVALFGAPLSTVKYLHLLCNLVSDLPEEPISDLPDRFCVNAEGLYVVDFTQATPKSVSLCSVQIAPFEIVPKPLDKALAFLSCCRRGCWSTIGWGEDGRFIVVLDLNGSVLHAHLNCFFRCGC
jgi:hypothetical protein